MLSDRQALVIEEGWEKQTDPHCFCVVQRNKPVHIFID